MIYTVEPVDHWKVGDRAYCVRGLKRDGRFIVETGRVYQVAEVQQYPGMMSDGLRLVGIDTGEVWGFWSSRFVCLRGPRLAIHQIEERACRSWLEAYRATQDARRREAA